MKKIILLTTLLTALNAQFVFTAEQGKHAAPSISAAEQEQRADLQKLQNEIRLLRGTQDAPERGAFAEVDLSDELLRLQEEKRRLLEDNFAKQRSCNRKRFTVCHRI